MNTTAQQPGMGAPLRRILIPLPDHDFDPTESAIPWQVCREVGWSVDFSTEHGGLPAADQRLLKGPILGPLGAGPKGLAAYRRMERDAAFRNPLPYEAIDPAQYDAVVLPGGHAPGMKQYLESRTLQQKVLAFYQQGKIIAAICHGVLVPARTIDPLTGRSLLYSHRVTALTKSLERTGYGLTFWLLGRRYRTYACYVADEVQNVLARTEDFETGPSMLLPFAMQDGPFITARWPLDAARFTQLLINRLIRPEGAAH
jgi:putative intracellular protease/amidase